jgi:phospholipase D1/2
MFHKVGLTSGKMDATAGDEALRDERTTYTKDGQKEPGFTSSSAPTLEEKVIEQNIHAGTAAGKELQKGDAPNGEAATSEGQLFGAPADAAKNDAEPPSGAGQKLSQDEKEAPGTRSILRKHLATKLGNGPWSLPVPRPNVDPHAFEDPIVDSFWKEMWLAGAVHNVGIFPWNCYFGGLLTSWTTDRDFPQSFPCNTR